MVPFLRFSHRNLYTRSGILQCDTGTVDPAPLKTGRSAYIFGG